MLGRDLHQSPVCSWHLLTVKREVELLSCVTGALVFVLQKDKGSQDKGERTLPQPAEQGSIVAL